MMLGTASTHRQDLGWSMFPLSLPITFSDVDMQGGCAILGFASGNVDIAMKGRVFALNSASASSAPWFESHASLLE